MTTLEVLNVETVVTITLRLSLDAVKDIALGMAEAAERCEDDETVRATYQALADEFDQIAESAK